MKMFSIHFVVYFIEESLTFLRFFLVLVQKKNPPPQGVLGDYYEKEKF